MSYRKSRPDLMREALAHLVHAREDLTHAELLERAATSGWMATQYVASAIEAGGELRVKLRTEPQHRHDIELRSALRDVVESHRSWARRLAVQAARLAHLARLAESR